MSDGCVPTDAEFHLRVQTAIMTDAVHGTSMFYEVPVVDSEGNTLAELIYLTEQQGKYGR